MQKHFVITYKTIVKASPQKTWEALTNPELVKQYFFGSILTTSWEPGSPIYFTGDWEGKPYRDKGVVQQFIPNQFLSYTYLSNWSGLPDEPDNYLMVTYELEANEEGTLLKITQSNYDATRAEHSLNNWKQVMDKMKKLIE